MQKFKAINDLTERISITITKPLTPLRRALDERGIDIGRDKLFPKLQQYCYNFYIKLIFPRII